MRIRVLLDIDLVTAQYLVASIKCSRVVLGLSSFLCEVVRFLVVGEIDAAGEHDRERV